MIELFIRFFKTIFLTPRISKYLKNGIYACREGMIIKIAKPAKLPLLLIWSKKKKKVSQYSECAVHFGGWSKKTVVLFDDKVVSFYYHKDYKTWFNNIKLYLTDCNYPKCEYYVFDEKERFNICSRVIGNGKQLSGEDLLSFAKSILIYNVSAKKIMNQDYQGRVKRPFADLGITNVISYVQHGDASKLNILCDGKQCRFIDFDTINVFPAFFDFFRLLIDADNGLQLYYKGFFDKELSEVLNTCSVALTASEKDKYLAAFCLFKEEWTRRIVIDDIPENYGLTLNAVKGYNRRSNNENSKFV